MALEGSFNLNGLPIPDAYIEVDELIYKHSTITVTLALYASTTAKSQGQPAIKKTSFTLNPASYQALIDTVEDAIDAELVNQVPYLSQMVSIQKVAVDSAPA